MRNDINNNCCYDNSLPTLLPTEGRVQGVQTHESRREKTMSRISDTCAELDMMWYATAHVILMLHEHQWEEREKRTVVAEALVSCLYVCTDMILK